jgi:hypothetical protein
MNNTLDEMGFPPTPAGLAAFLESERINEISLEDARDKLTKYASERHAEWFSLWVAQELDLEVDVDQMSERDMESRHALGMLRCVERRIKERG